MMINPLSLAKLEACAMAMLGLLAGIIYSVGGLFYDLFFGIGLNYGTLLAFLALLGMPLLFSSFGFLFGLVSAYLCNIFSKITGITFEL